MPECGKKTPYMFLFSARKQLTSGTTLKLPSIVMSSTTTSNNYAAPTAILTPFILWNIWKSRNNSLSKNKNAPFLGINTQNMSFNALKFYHLAYCPLSNSPRCTISVQWHRPPVGFIKLNIDGSFDPNTNNGGTRGVMINHIGDLITGFTCKVRVKNAHHLSDGMPTDEACSAGG